MNRQNGQSLVEVIFSIGVLVMVITAVISLIVKTTNVKSMEIQRKKASEMSEVIIEDLLDNKKNNPDGFWAFEDIGTSKTISGYDGYSYSVDLVNNTGCSDGKCADATVVINWGNGQEFTVKRFFSDKM
jgi:Tfp pilus assembly protein PilV